MLAYTDSGDGPPVVLVHGLTCNAAYWLRVVPLLEDLRVIAIDLRGHGLSEHRESYRYDDYVSDLLSLLDELGLDRVPVAGHSLPFSFLDGVHCRTFVMAGAESDVMPPPSAARFAAAIPGATLEVVEGVGHHVELEAPERIATRLLELV